MERNSFLNYYKTILEKVSFDHLLLKKEYNKALQTLHSSDHSKLDQWMYKNGLMKKLNERNDLKQTA